jgi:hypothetical protein
MIGNAARFGFPVDDLFWVIKYIDQFNQAYRRTRTTSVLIMLQRLLITNARELAAMTPESCQAFLGKQKKRFTSRVRVCFCPRRRTAGTDHWRRLSQRTKDWRTAGYPPEALSDDGYNG